MRKTEAMAEATSKKQEASPDLVSNRTGSSHAALPFGGATVFLMKLFDFEKEHWRISYFASAKAEMLLTSSRRINTREDVKI